MNKSEKIDQLAAALSKAQAEMRNPPLDGRNPHFNSRFATLAGVRDTVLPVLAKHGLAVIQSAGSGERGPTLTTLLMHASGQWVETDALVLPATKQDPQGYCSALTYSRRYSLMALAGVVGEDDDDGNAASAQQRQKPQPRQEKPAAAAVPAKPEKPAKAKDPRTGKEFKEWLLRYDRDAAARGRWRSGDLVEHVHKHVTRDGAPEDMEQWGEAAVRIAKEEVKVYCASHPEKQAG